jgi:hypothetical protein
VADYLGQLVQRGRQPDNAIQPRLSSRFEPPRPATVDVPTVWMPVERESHPLFAPADPPVDSITESGSPQVHRRATGALSVDPGARVEEQSPEGPADSHVGSRIGTRPARRRDPGAGPLSGDTPVRRERREAHTVKPVRPRRERESPVAVRVAPVPGTSVAPIQTAPQIEQPANRAANRRWLDNPALPEPIAIKRHRRGAEPQPETTLEPRPIVKVAPNVGLEALRPSASRPAELPDAERSPAPDAPTIHVTIGRVEIRASVAAPVSRKPQARPPAMSLEEYLKQRKGATRE